MTLLLFAESCGYRNFVSISFKVVRNEGKGRTEVPIYSARSESVGPISGSTFLALSEGS